MESELSFSQKQRFDSILLLKDKGYFNPATYLCWTYVRSGIFKILTNRDLEYESTEQAIHIFFNTIQSTDIHEKIYSLYTIATLADFDETFLIDSKDFSLIFADFKTIVHALKNDK